MKLPVSIRKVSSSNPFFNAKFIIEDAEENYIAESTKEYAAARVAHVLNSHGAAVEGAATLLERYKALEAQAAIYRKALDDIRSFTAESHTIESANLALESTDAGLSLLDRIKRLIDERDTLLKAWYDAQEPDADPWEAVFTPGNIKAWRIVRKTGDDCWTEYPGNVVAECVSEEDGETKLFTVDEVAFMLPGLDVEAGGWTVQCRLVAREWLDNLPEHCGW